jgi:hypothetical protein
MFGFPLAEPFTPTRWLADGDAVSVGHCALAVRHDLLAQTCQSLDLLPKPPDLAALVQAFAATASAQGMAIGHWDMAIVKASPEKSALKPSQAEST